MLNDEVRKLVKKFVGNDVTLEVPPDSKLGDFAFACFQFAKELKKSPVLVAKDLAAKIKPEGVIKAVQASGPYVNIFLDTGRIGGLVIRRVEEEREHFGSSHAGKGRHALIEHTSINPNASPHVGRARNAFIGDCLARVLRFEGYQTEVHYFVNDVGKQIAMLVVGCKNRKTVSFNDLLNIYIDINQRAESDPAVEKEVFDLLNKFEAGDQAVRKKFREIVDVCVKGQAKILGELGIRYDHFDYESDYIVNKTTDKVLSELKKTSKVFVDEEKRHVLDLKGFDLPLESPVLVLTRGDGTSLYPLRDLAYTIDKNSWAKGKNILVLGEDQKLYQEQLTAALSLLSQSAPEVVHYSFVLLSSGKMSTRKGNVVLLTDFMDEAVKRAHAAMSRDFSKEKAEALARTVAFGAVKFTILKVANEKSVMFDWNAALAFEGDTAPYCQYAHARVHSIFRKANVHDPRLPDNALFSSPHEHQLIVALAGFQGAVRKTLAERNPSVLVHYVVSVSKAFSEFYHQCPVIDAEEGVQMSRLALINAVRIVLENGLHLLGIDAPDEM
ncbi:arginine--tRNA ligase [Candidatus Woesearchaeota archaeon]|nr:arginine--tRNA ligase [Candidatus Woesearchaeota archaeon]